MYLVAKQPPMIGSTRFRHRFGSILFVLLPMHLSDTLLQSTEALTLPISSRRPCTTLPIPGGSSSFFRHSTHKHDSVLCYSTREPKPDTTNDSGESSLAESISRSYAEKETDGVVELATTSSLLTDLSVDIEDDLIPAILEASGGRKGIVASIMNAMIGSGCHFIDETKTKAGTTPGLVSDRVLSLMEGLFDAADVTPDIVTYSLAYEALSKDDPDDTDGLADSILETAERSSKKIAGGKRRKLLASSRRKVTSSFSDAEDDLRELLGADFEVLLETDGFAVVNKPSGVPCFHARTTTAGKIKRGKGKKKKGKKGQQQNENKANDRLPSDVSLEDALVSCNVPLSTLNPEALGLVHRLDRGSSGCLILAKTNELHARLVSEFFLRRTTKQYVALVRETQASSISKKGSIDHAVGGRSARSDYQLLERYRSDGDDAAMVGFEIFTGRKHQIRVHAAEVLGSPVWGDPLYGAGDGGPNTKPPQQERIFLHASRLKIPVLGVDVESPVPSWWESTLSTFGEKNETKD
ncbi:unnamed protein product [Pseudo-nitzschia multistriata]|uniref:Pseudouridine synthase RsuA/RluA-like domain-containing protein n=1 Tax=Pseudo-nitzschia multistriata TaxID=183589 RepID=A0A448ZR86_9STRA|nr:unnamed protein product [Pseudo-nitzschia multistriata]